VKPTLALTIGDPAGIGPEITLRALLLPELHQRAKLVAVGSLPVLQHAAEKLGITISFTDFGKGGDSFSTSVPLHQVGDLGASDYTVGSVSARTGQESADYVRAAAELSARKLVDGIVTAPINKEALRDAGIKYPGHTEMLGGFLDSHVETMFVVDKLRIFFLTRHLSLSNAIRAVTKESLLKLLAHVRSFLETLDVAEPVIAVAALNPHGGEGGLFGTEEMEQITPAVQEARRRGWDVRGPIGADSVFHQALQGRYDAVISLYHDQGHIAAKTYDFNRTVSVTTGLPTVRTSVDHGTALDIAGSWIADPTNMIEAIKVAADLALRRRATTPA